MTTKKEKCEKENQKDVKTKVIEELMTMEPSDPSQSPSHLFMDWLTEKRMDETGNVALVMEYGHTVGVKRALNVKEFGKDHLWIELELLSRAEFKKTIGGLYMPGKPGEKVWLNTRNILYAYDLK